MIGNLSIHFLEKTSRQHHSQFNLRNRFSGKWSPSSLRDAHRTRQRKLQQSHDPWFLSRRLFPFSSETSRMAAWNGVYGNSTTLGTWYVRDGRSAVSVYGAANCEFLYLRSFKECSTLIYDLFFSFLKYIHIGGRYSNEIIRVHRVGRRRWYLERGWHPRFETFCEFTLWRWRWHDRFRRIRILPRHGPLSR